MVDKHPKEGEKCKCKNIRMLGLYRVRVIAQMCHLCLEYELENLINILIEVI